VLDLDVFVVGGVGIDVVVAVNELPLPLRDAIMVPPIRQYVGHTGNGVALGCHALGLRALLADVIGADPEGRLVLDTYAAAGLEFRHVTHPSGTRRAVNLVDRAGRRESLYDARHPFEFVPDTALWAGGIARARHVHISIMNWARHALADAVAAGRTTSTDLHDWDGEADYHRDFAYGADYVFVSAAALGERVDAVLGDILGRGRAVVAVAMDGARGSRLAVRGEPVRVVPAVTLPGRPVVDSNGAGDSYVAAFLRTVLAGGDWELAAAAGAIGGGYACGTAGTHTSFVDAAQLDAELAAIGAGR
jgi:sugar/nucleoside kinase (ribokinase family)